MKKIETVLSERYVQVPIFMLRELLTDKEKTLNDILHYGTYNLSKIIKFKPLIFDEEKMEQIHCAIQLVYAYYRKKTDVPKDILIELDWLHSVDGWVEQPFNSKGYTGNVLETASVLERMDSNEEFKNKVLVFGKRVISNKILDFKGSFEYAEKIGKEIDGKISKKQVYVDISTEKIIEFRDNPKDEFELMTFAYYCGVRSILGKQISCKTHKMRILARALGYTHEDELEGLNNPYFKQFSTRHMLDKLVKEVEANWYTHFYGIKSRGFHVASKNKISLEKLIERVEKKKEKSRALKEEKQLLREKTLAEIYSTTATS